MEDPRTPQHLSTSRALDILPWPVTGYFHTLTSPDPSRGVEQGSWDPTQTSLPRTLDTISKGLEKEM